MPQNASYCAETIFATFAPSAQGKAINFRLGFKKQHSEFTYQSGHKNLISSVQLPFHQNIKSFTSFLNELYIRGLGFNQFPHNQVFYFRDGETYNRKAVCFPFSDGT